MTGREESPLGRLRLGQDVRCADGPAGEVGDVVIDPPSGRVTHLVVLPRGEPARARLIPLELVGSESGDAVLELRCTLAQLRSAPDVRELGSPDQVLRADDGGEQWDVGVQEAVVVPGYDAGAFVDYVPGPMGDIMRTFDRVPKGEVELRRSSSVTTVDGDDAGLLDGFALAGGAITHVIVERGHFWHRRAVAVPIGAIESLRTDDVVVRLTKAELDGLPDAPG